MTCENIPLVYALYTRHISCFAFHLKAQCCPLPNFNIRSLSNVFWRLKLCKHWSWLCLKKCRKESIFVCQSSRVTSSISEWMGRDESALAGALSLWRHGLIDRWFDKCSDRCDVIKKPQNVNKPLSISWTWAGSSLITSEAKQVCHLTL